jgi:hypothetical protein
MATGADSLTDGRGMAYGDFDNDGDLDIVMNTNPGDCGKASVPPVLYRNDLAQGRNWLAVELVGTRCNREAVGSEVHVRCAGGARGTPYRAMRHATIGSGYASQNSHRLQFGLGQDHSIVGALTVRWPGGGEQTIENIRANQWIRITQGGDVVAFDPREPSASPDKLSSASRDVSEVDR